MNPLGLIFLVVMVVSCVPLYLLPSTFRADTFFGVTVDADFLSSYRAKRIVWNYRKPLMVVTALSLIAIGVDKIMHGVEMPILAISCFLVHFVVAIGAFIGGNKQALPFAKPQSGSRRASLEPSRRTLPGGWTLFSGPMLITLFSGFLVFAKHDGLPAETVRGAMSSVLVGFFASSLFLWLGYLSIFRTRKTLDGKSRRYGYFSFLFVAYSMALFNASTTLTAAKIIGDGSSGRVFGGVVLLWFVGLLVAISVTLRSKPQLVKTEETPDDCWKWGLIYYNPEDPAFLVEKRIGYGWTLNCGNRWSWVFIVAILAAPFVLRYFWFRQG